MPESDRMSGIYLGDKAYQDSEEVLTRRLWERKERMRRIPTTGLPVIPRRSVTQPGVVYTARCYH